MVFGGWSARMRLCLAPGNRATGPWAWQCPTIPQHLPAPAHPIDPASATLMLRGTAQVGFHALEVTRAARYGVPGSHEARKTSKFPLLVSSILTRITVVRIIYAYARNRPYRVPESVPPSASPACVS